MEPKMTLKDASEFLNLSLQGINKAIKTKGIKYQKSANRIYWGHESSKEIFDLDVKAQTVSFQVVKGGTGKTALAMNFAIRASLYGLKVLCIDLDQQGNLTDLMGVNSDELACMIDSIVDPKSFPFKDLIVEVLPGLDLVPSNLDNALLENTILVKKPRLDKLFTSRIDQVRHEYDLIVMDCPPALGSVNAAAALASDVVVAVVDPDRNAVKGLHYTYEEISKLAKDNDREIPVRIILNKFDKRTSLSHHTLESLMKHPVFGNMLYPCYIGISQQIPNANAKMSTIFDTLKESSAKVDIDLMTREILELDEILKAKQIRDKDLLSKRAQSDKPVDLHPAT